MDERKNWIFKNHSSAHCMYRAVKGGRKLLFSCVFKLCSIKSHSYCKSPRIGTAGEELGVCVYMHLMFSDDGMPLELAEGEHQRQAQAIRIA